MLYISSELSLEQLKPFSRGFVDWRQACERTVRGTCERVYSEHFPPGSENHRTAYQFGLWYDLLLRPPSDECRRAIFRLPVELRAKKEVSPVLGFRILIHSELENRRETSFEGRSPFGLYSYMRITPSSSPVTMDISPSAKKKSPVVTQTRVMSLARTTSLYGSSCSRR